DLDHLLPEEHFRLVAASMRFPRQLASRVALQPQGPGAYDVVWGTDTIRILVLRDMPDAEQNLVWNLFRGDQARIGGAFQRLQPRLPRWSSILNDLLEYYGLEGMPMPYTMEDFERDVELKILRRMKFDKVLAGLTPEQRREILQSLTPEQRREILQSLPSEERLAGLPVAERLAGLSAEQMRKYLDQLARPKPRRKK